MAYLYLDESGISSAEANAVVAGILAFTEGQVNSLERQVDRLIEKHIPFDMRDGFAFHATDIWSSKKLYKDRDFWTVPRRDGIILDLVSIPAELQLLVLHGSVEKEDQRRRYSTASPQEYEKFHHAVAFAKCVLLADRVMREQYNSEVLQVVAEDNNEMRTLLTQTHALFSDANAMKKSGIDDEDAPYRHVLDSIIFERKNRKALQVADACAFIIRRYLDGKDDVKKYFEHIEPAIVHIKV